MNKYDLVKRLRKNCGLTEAEVEKLIKAKDRHIRGSAGGRGTGFSPRFPDVRICGTGRPKRTQPKDR